MRNSSKSIGFVVKVFFHLLPLMPLLFHYYFLAVAFVLLVLSAYIKTFKIEKELGDNPDLRNRSIEQRYQTMLFWRRLTFLKPLLDNSQS